MIGNTGDPATPYEGARKMVERLGPGVGVELTYKGQGHGAYNSGDPCVQKAVDTYLLDGKVPPVAPSAPGASRPRPLSSSRWRPRAPESGESGTARSAGPPPTSQAPTALAVGACGLVRSAGA